jgi:YVTN family beta-propeller protein
MNRSELTVVSSALVILLLAGYVKGVSAATTEIIPIALDESPCKMVMDSSRLYVTGTDHLYVIDTVTNDIVAKIQVEKSSCGVAINSAKGIQYVINGEAHIVQLINGTSNRVVKTIPLDDSNPLDIVFDSKNDKIFVNFGSPAGGGVLVIDGSSNKVVDTLSMPNPYGIALNENLGRIYAINWNYPNSSVSVIDGTTNKVVDTIPGIGGRSHAIAVNAKTNLVYVDNFDESDGGSNYLSVIDGSTNKIVSNVTLFDGWHSLAVGSQVTAPVRLAVDSENNIIYATNYWSKTLYAINGTSNQVINSLRMNDSILDVAVNSAQERVYVTDVSTKTINVISSTAIVPEFPISTSLVMAGIPMIAIVAYTIYSGHKGNRTSSTSHSAN